ncbi:hypothetical protein [Acinetobacter radioresistens]|uniref:hypothetical protein n=1 Tax=Acinetobacter radioresistens TaxID=40216 RepID=UPI00124FEFD4|nr:hypothetical protein [Acinetobacter radioresistens]
MGELTIEQMQQIVSDAPENSQVVIPCSDGVMYFAQREDGKWFRYSDGYQKWLEYFGKCDPMDVAIKLADIKSEIDHHYYGRSEAEELAAYAELSQEKIEGGAMFIGDNSKVVQMVRDITDHCSDIKNHISPNTKVIER